MENFIQRETSTTPVPTQVVGLNLRRTHPLRAHRQWRLLLHPLERIAPSHDRTFYGRRLIGGVRRSSVGWRNQTGACTRSRLSVPNPEDASI